jgi:hypothetical protein
MLEYGEIEQANRLRCLLLPPFLVANTHKKFKQIIENYLKNKREKKIKSKQYLQLCQERMKRRSNYGSEAQSREEDTPTNNPIWVFGQSREDLHGAGAGFEPCGGRVLMAEVLPI